MDLSTISFQEFKSLANAETSCSGNCHVAKALQVLGGKWSLLVLYQLCKRPSFRFGELRKAIPDITNTMLTSTLRELEEFGIVLREQYNEIPPRVEYSLTQKGKDLFPTFFELAKWSIKYL